MLNIALIVFAAMSATGCFVGAYYYWNLVSADEMFRARLTDATPEAPKQTTYTRFVQPYAAQLAHLFPGLRERMTSHKVEQNLVYAGTQHGLTGELFWGIRILSLFFFFYLGVMLTIMFGINLIITTVGMSMFGLWWPLRWLNSIATSRQAELDLMVTELLDLLTISLEAGMGFEPALDLTIRRLRTPLQDEARRMLVDMRLSVPFVRAMEGVIERTDSADLHAFLHSLILTKQLGTPLVDTIIEQSEAINKRRIANVKERVNKVVPRATGVLAVLTVLGMGVLLLGLLALSMLMDLGIL